MWHIAGHSFLRSRTELKPRFTGGQNRASTPLPAGLYGVQSRRHDLRMPMRPDPEGKTGRRMPDFWILLVLEHQPRQYFEGLQSAGKTKPTFCHLENHIGA